MVYYSAFDRGWTYDAFDIPQVESRARAERYLKAAQVYPTALSYQVSGLLHLYDGQHAEALADFKEALVIDSSDPSSYAYLAIALIADGRSADAVGHIRTALRLDPSPPSSFDYILGRALFALEQFEAAATSAERATRLNSDEDYAFLLLAATYGHLGRKAEAMAAVARFNELRIHRGFIPTAIDTAPSMSMRLDSDIKRFHDGLRMAGVPESLFDPDGEFASQNRLNAEEAQRLLVGHKLRGRSIWSGELYTESTTADGLSTRSGAWGNFSGLKLQATDGQVCFKKLCGSVFRNPGGLVSKENEYIWYDGSGTFTFSQIE
jgi:tetratricopeptide (TPR) repeat protein